MDQKKKDRILGVVRHLLTFLGGVIVTHGMAEDVVVQELIGATMTVVGGIWSIVAKK